MEHSALYTCVCVTVSDRKRIDLVIKYVNTLRPDRHRCSLKLSTILKTVLAETTILTIK